MGEGIERQLPLAWPRVGKKQYGSVPSVGGSAFSSLPRLAFPSASSLLLACIPRQIAAVDIAPQHWAARPSATEGGEAAAGVVVQAGKEAVDGRGAT